MASRNLRARGECQAVPRRQGQPPKRFAESGNRDGRGSAPTIGVDAAQQVLVQTHLIEGVVALLPLGKESFASLGDTAASPQVSSVLQGGDRRCQAAGGRSQGLIDSGRR